VCALKDQALSGTLLPSCRSTTGPQSTAPARSLASSRCCLTVRMRRPGRAGALRAPVPPAHRLRVVAALADALGAHRRRARRGGPAAGGGGARAAARARAGGAAARRARAGAPGAGRGLRLPAQQLSGARSWAMGPPGSRLSTTGSRSGVPVPGPTRAAPPLTCTTPLRSTRAQTSAVLFCSLPAHQALCMAGMPGCFPQAPGRLDRYVHLQAELTDSLLMAGRLRRRTRAAAAPVYVRERGRVVTPSRTRAGSGPSSAWPPFLPGAPAPGCASAPATCIPASQAHCSRASARPAGGCLRPVRCRRPLADRSCRQPGLCAAACSPAAQIKPSAHQPERCALISMAVGSGGRLVASARMHHPQPLQQISCAGSHPR